MFRPSTTAIFCVDCNNLRGLVWGRRQVVVYKKVVEVDI
jgi:hypothetical protein